MFAGVLRNLHQTGHAESRNPPAIGTRTTQQDQRLALHCRQWLKSELLTDQELENHYFLARSYPTSTRRRRRRREAGDESEEPLAQRARAAVDQTQSVDTDRLAGVLEPCPGEDLDDEVENRRCRCGRTY